MEGGLLALTWVVLLIDSTKTDGVHWGSPATEGTRRPSECFWTTQPILTCASLR